jgi:hypothetical protein
VEPVAAVLRHGAVGNGRAALGHAPEASLPGRHVHAGGRTEAHVPSSAIRARSGATIPARPARVRGAPAAPAAPPRHPGQTREGQGLAGAGGAEQPDHAFGARPGHPRPE